MARAIENWHFNNSSSSFLGTKHPLFSSILLEQKLRNNACYTLNSYRSVYFQVIDIIYILGNHDNKA